MNGKRKCSSIQQMAFGKVTSLLILELAIIRRISSENVCHKHLNQLHWDSWCPTFSIRTGLELEGRSSGKGLSFTAWMVSMASLQMLTSHPFWAACLVSKGTTSCLPSRASWGTQTKSPIIWPHWASELCT